jgi:hypothetical protein
MSAAVGWWAGLVIIKHPLLAQMRSAASKLAFAAPGFPVSGRVNDVHSGEKLP